MKLFQGVSSFVASAAVLGKELTLPELSQTVIISRCEGRTPVPDKEKLSMLAEHQSTLVLFLSAALIHKVVDELSPHYGKDCPVAVVQRATWPNQLIVRGTLDDIADKDKTSKNQIYSNYYRGSCIDIHGFCRFQALLPGILTRF